MASITITWHILDDAACWICKQINGYTWTFTDGVPDELVHPEFGVVWSVSMGSMAHGHPRQFCRCSLTNTLDLSDLIVRMTRIRDLIKASVESPELEVTRG